MMSWQYENWQERIITMKIIVDLNRCQSYGQCCFAAPDVFRFQNGEALAYDPAPDEARRTDVIRAAKACPVQAIQIGLDDENDEAFQRKMTYGQSNH
jgi:ferredoxin